MVVIVGSSAGAAADGDHVDRVQLDRVVQSSRGVVSVPGPLQSVQRAELWGVIFLSLADF